LFGVEVVLVFGTHIDRGGAFTGAGIHMPLSGVPAIEVHKVLGYEWGERCEKWGMHGVVS
jgi:hypothetical protein